jgi:hypothetical protein
MPFNQRVVKIIGVAVAAVVIVLLVLPRLINANSFRPKIESEFVPRISEFPLFFAKTPQQLN